MLFCLSYARFTSGVVKSLALSVSTFLVRSSIARCVVGRMPSLFAYPYGDVSCVIVFLLSRFSRSGARRFVASLVAVVSFSLVGWCFYTFRMIVIVPVYSLLLKL